MKILKRILFIIWAFMMLLIGLILLCTWKPELTDQIADFLYPDRRVGISSDMDPGNADMQVSVEFPDDDTSVTNGENGNGEQQGAGEGAGQQGVGQDAENAAGQKGVGSAAEQQGTGQGQTSVYDPPSQSELKVPAQVSGKSGYQEVQENQEQIGEEAADQLSNQLDIGETGDGLTFDPLFYPYYHMLDEKGQHLYRQIYANANALHEAFAPVEDVRAGEIRNVFAAVYNDHPELFWVETAYSCKYRRNGQCVELQLTFNRTARNLDQARGEFESRVQEILATAQTAPSSYDKEKLVHDVLLNQIEYQAAAEMNQSAYSALVNGQTVCAGYARAFQYLMQRLGIPCYYCTGYAGENHAWNILLLDDGYYNVDVTWDDTEGANYDFFNKTDQDYAGTHLRKELSVNLPACNGQQYRNLEQSQAAESGLRSLEELGLADSAVRYSLEEYYQDCYNQMLNAGLGSYTFYTVVEGEALAGEIALAYQGDAYRQGYMEPVMMAMGASSCQLRVETEPLHGGRYLMGHTVTLTGN